jgi:hypothetical protein
MDAFHRKAHCSRRIGWSCHPLPNTTPPYTDRTNTRLCYKESLKGFLPELNLANQPARVATRTRQCSGAFGGGLNAAAAIRKMLGSGLPIGTCCVAASWRALVLPKACQKGHGGGRNGKPNYRVQLQGDLLPRVSVSRQLSWPGKGQCCTVLSSDWSVTTSRHKRQCKMMTLTTTKGEKVLIQPRHLIPSDNVAHVAEQVFVSPGLQLIVASVGGCGNTLSGAAVPRCKETGGKAAAVAHKATADT